MRVVNKAFDWEQFRTIKRIMKDKRHTMSNKISELTAQKKDITKKITTLFKLMNPIKNEVSAEIIRNGSYHRMVNLNFEKIEKIENELIEYRVNYIFRIMGSRLNVSGDEGHINLESDRQRAKLSVEKYQQMIIESDQKIKFLTAKLKKPNEDITQLRVELTAISSEIDSIEKERSVLDKTVSKTGVLNQIVSCDMVKHYVKEGKKKSLMYFTIRHTTLIEKTQEFIIGLLDYVRLSESFEEHGTPGLEKVLWYKIKENRPLYLQKEGKMDELEELYVNYIAHQPT